MNFIRGLWKWSPLVTLPIAVVFTIWTVGAADRWYQFEVKMRTSTKLDLHTVGILEAQHLMREISSSVTGAKRDELLKASELRSIHLFIQKIKLNKLNSNIPHSSFDYVDAGLYYDGAVREIDARYRGDNVYHWGYWKKSWRIKTKRNQLFDGMRKFNLVAPRTTEMINNYLALEVASSMGLITPKVELVNVTLNGKILGLYILTEQLEESTVRRHGRMPGDLYSGELVGGDSYNGIRNNLFDSAGLWTKVAVNNHFDEASVAPLEALLAAVESTNRDNDNRQLESIADIDAFAKSSVYESVVGTVHVNDLHNWRLYYDPWTTKIVPIPWDPVGWHHSVRTRPGYPFRPDVISSQLHLALHRNGNFLAAKSHCFQEFFATGKDKVLLKELEETIRSIKPILLLDPNFVEEGKLKQPEEVLGSLLTLRSYIEAHLEDLKQAHLSPGADLTFHAEDPGNISLALNSGRLLEDLRIRYFQPIEGPVSGRIHWLEDSGEQSLDVSNSILSTSGGQITFDIHALADIRFKEKAGKPLVGYLGGTEVFPASYRIHLTGIPKDSQILEVRAQVDGHDVVASQRFEPIQHSPLASISSRVKGYSEKPTQVWRGQLRMQGMNIIDDPVVILEGTQVLMDPGASIIFRELVQARGTSENPIEFIPSEGQGANFAWGTIATKGEGGNGSTFRGCRFVGGSGTKHDTFEYSAMFSVHETKNVVVEDCEFVDNYHVDDMVHGVYTDIHFRRCVWTRSLSDALDLDISNAVVENCRFVDSGNDAIDLMTTHASVVGCAIMNSGDKGISIGEASQLVAVANIIDGCAIGLQSKDDSLALVVNSELIRCANGVDAYKKNWRYDGGGTMYLVNSKILDSPEPLSADSHSLIGLDDCFVDSYDFSETRKEISHYTCDSSSPDRSKTPQQHAFQNRRLEALLGEADSRWRSRIDMGSRGLPK